MNELDRILSSESPITPSPGFTRSVMTSIRREAEPPPLAFPWRRLLIGLASSGLVLLGSTLIIPFLPQPSINTEAVGQLVTKTAIGPVGQLALTLLVSFLSIRLSFRLAGHRD